MSTLAKTKPTAAVIIPRYGITEKKKAELDALTIDILDASHVVEQFQAIVLSLTEKSNIFQDLLGKAESDRSKALNNKGLIDQLVQNTLDLESNSRIALHESGLSDSKTKDLALQIKVVIDKLIYSVEMINKLATQVVRKKKMNPLISDDLVSMITAAGSDANNAVALTLVALKSVFAAQASNMESKAASALEYSQSLSLYQVMTGSTHLLNTIKRPATSSDSTKPGKKEEDSQPAASLVSLINDAYTKAKENYERAHQAFIITNNQLNEAQVRLNKAQIKLRSLQLGLAAGNAAALAS